MGKTRMNLEKRFDPKVWVMFGALILFSLIVTFRMNNYTVLVVNMALINMITAYGLSIMLGTVSYTHLTLPTNREV